jgi:hypothetical protein
VIPSGDVCNGLDDDCDGVPDENNPGGGTSCTAAAFGICANGVTACVMGAIACQPGMPLPMELCNGLDDDCDNMVDEGNPGGGGACTAAAPGICANGSLTCQNGMLQCAPGQPLPSELCNNLDDDCDGVIDEGNPGGGASCVTGLPGICSAGTTACMAGGLQCVQNQQAQAEICSNNLDDDCDGVVNNTCCTNVLPDPSFEAGPNGGIWTESSTNFGTPICNVGFCGGTGNGTGARTGTHWSWFGGIAGAAETGIVSKVLTIPNTGLATLTFYLELPACDTAGPAETLTVRMDGNTLFTANNTHVDCNLVGYKQTSVNINSYANGASHTLSFTGVFLAGGAGTTNFMVDDVAVNSCIP